MKLHQPARAPTFPIGLVTQMLCFCKDDDTGCATGEWSTGTITTIRNRKNLRNNNGSYFSKGKAAKVRRYANVDKNE